MTLSKSTLAAASMLGFGSLVSTAVIFSEYACPNLPHELVNNNFDGEVEAQEGECIDGECTLYEIPFGCKGLTPPLLDPEERPLGCTFVCKNPDTKKAERGFYDPGTPCQHDEEGKYLNGTCMKRGNMTLCSVDVVSLQDEDNQMLG